MVHIPRNVALLVLVTAPLALNARLRRNNWQDVSDASPAGGDFMDEYLAHAAKSSTAEADTSAQDAGGGSASWGFRSAARAAKSSTAEADASAQDSGSASASWGFKTDMARFDRMTDGLASSPMSSSSSSGSHTHDQPNPTSDVASEPNGAVIDIRLDSELQESISLMQVDPFADSDASSAPGDYMDQYIKKSEDGPTGSVWREPSSPVDTSRRQAPEQHAMHAHFYDASSSDAPSTQEAVEPRGAVVDIRLDSELQKSKSLLQSDGDGDGDQAPADFMDQYIKKTEDAGTGSVWWNKESQGSARKHQDETSWTPAPKHESRMQEHDDAPIQSHLQEQVYQQPATSNAEDESSPTGAVVDVTLDSELQEGYRAL